MYFSYSVYRYINWRWMLWLCFNVLKATDCTFYYCADFRKTNFGVRASTGCSHRALTGWPPGMAESVGADWHSHNLKISRAQRFKREKNRPRRKSGVDRTKACHPEFSGICDEVSRAHQVVSCQISTVFVPWKVSTSFHNLLIYVLGGEVDCEGAWTQRGASRTAAGSTASCHRLRH